MLLYEKSADQIRLAAGRNPAGHYYYRNGRPCCNGLTVWLGENCSAVRGDSGPVTITDISTVNESDFIKGPAVKIGIFLSILDVHINRAPCNVKVEKITYRKGRYSNAANPRSGKINTSNDLWLARTDEPADRIIVRQISGAIARRIVCDIKQGQNLSGGEKFGMIKFGSRTELYLPEREGLKTLVNIGDKVKAGITTLARYQ